MKRTNYSSATPLEEKMGYSCMVKVGNMVFVGGTPSVQPDGTVFGEGDAIPRRNTSLKSKLSCW